MSVSGSASGLRLTGSAEGDAMKYTDPLLRMMRAWPVEDEAKEDRDRELDPGRRLLPATEKKHCDFEYCSARLKLM